MLGESGEKGTQHIKLFQVRLETQQRRRMEGGDAEVNAVVNGWNRNKYHSLPEGPRFSDYACYVPRSIRCYFGRVLAVFSWRFVGFLFFSQFFIKGALHRLSMGAMLPLFKALGVDAVQFQLYMTVAMVPWSIKPLVGLASDLVVLGGYHKRWWMVQSIVVGTASAALLLVVHSAAGGPGVMVLCFVGLHYEISVLDLLSEGKYAQIMRDEPRSGSDVITLVNGYQMAGGIVAMSFVGYMADRGYWAALFVIFMCLALVPLAPAIAGWLPEQKRNIAQQGMRECCRSRGRRRRRGCCCCVSELFMVDRDRFRSQKQIILVVGFTGLAGPVMAVISTYGSRIAGIVVAAIMMVGALAGSKVAFNDMVFRVALYQTLSAVSKPSIGGALDYFYTADEVCLPGGPHFSFKYYLTYTGLVGTAVSFVAVWIYQAWFSKWRYRSVLIFTTVLVGVAGIMDLLMVLRVNIALGISDHVAYIAGEAVFENVLIMLYWIPSSAILSKVVPKGMESSSYAFLAGLSNFSGMVSELTGAMIYDAAGVKTTVSTAVGGSCNFEALWWLVIAFHIILPILIGVPAALLIPNCKQTEELNVDGSARRDTGTGLDGEGDEGEAYEFIELSEVDEEETSILAMSEYE